MENPFRQLRVSAGLTQNEMAQIANIQPSAIGQAEEGMHEQPLKAYLLALGILPDTEEFTSFTYKYHRYQSFTRKQNGTFSSHPKLILSPEFSINENPLLTWRNQSDLSRYGLCRAYCLHLARVNKFESTIESTHDFLIAPLTEAGYEIDDFIEACIIYKETGLNHQRVLNNLPPVGQLAV